MMSSSANSLPLLQTPKVEVEKTPGPTIPPGDRSGAPEGPGPPNGGPGVVASNESVINSTVRAAIVKAYRDGVTNLQTLVIHGIESVEHLCNTVDDVATLEANITR